MGLPRATHVYRSDDPKSKIAQWLARIGLHCDGFTHDAAERANIRRRISYYVREVEATWGTFGKKSDYQRALNGVTPTLLERDLLENVGVFAATLKLGALETEILSFAVAIQSDSRFSSVVSTIDGTSQHKMLDALHTVLAFPVEAIRQVCSASGELVRMRLLELDWTQYDLSSALRVSDPLAIALGGPQIGIAEILSCMFEEAIPPTLTREDFAHLASDVKLMMTYLGNAVDGAHRGVNILLYGWPGTGKTELARLAATELGLKAVEVKMTGPNREPATPRERLASFNLAQAYLQKARGHFIIFDEVEEMFDSFADGFGTPKLFSKLWMNRQLEENAVPTIWIANSLDQIDAAHLRRFDIAIPFKALPMPARLRIMDKHLGKIAMAQVERQRLASRPQLLPSQISAAVKVANIVGDDDTAAETVVRVVDNSMKLLQQDIELQREKQFYLSFVNTKFDIDELFDSIREGRLHKFGIEGPSGSGKSGLAHFIAANLGLEAHIVQLASLFAPHRHDGEQRLAQEFATARREGCMLVLDDANMVATAAESEQRWLDAMVTALVTQLDSFDGVVCIVAIHVSGFPSSVKRRFHAIVTLDYLQPSQSEQLLDELCGFDNIGPAQLKRLERMQCLTLADFESATRRARVGSAERVAERVIDELESLNTVNSTSSRKIGFA